MTFFRRITPGERIPRLHGVCWFDDCRRQAVTAPIGANLILRLARAAWLWMLHPIRFFDAAYEAHRLRGELYEADRTIRRYEFHLERLGVLHDAKNDHRL